MKGTQHHTVDSMREHFMMANEHERDNKASLKGTMSANAMNTTQTQNHLNKTELIRWMDIVIAGHMGWPHIPEPNVNDQDQDTSLMPRSKTPKEEPKPYTKMCTGDPKPKEDGEEAKNPEEGTKPKQDHSKGK
jgi:hypothetical protein